jgi:Cysteine-rich CWC
MRFRNPNHHDELPSPVVSRDPICPICGQPNDCVLARLESLAEPCWCAKIEVSADAISKIPEEMRGKSCICHNCASLTKP